MRGLAEIARDFGDGDIRLTVWQNPLISRGADDRIDAAVAAIEALGLSTRANSIRGGPVRARADVAAAMPHLPRPIAESARLFDQAYARTGRGRTAGRAGWRLVPGCPDRAS